jgi:AraC-like DNA-binding protein
MALTAVSYQTRTNSPRSRSWARASGLLVDAWLLERQPPADLAGQLVCAWRGDIGEARTLLPDECVDMVWVGGSVWVSGPETRSWPCAAAPGTDAVGVCFRSGVAPSLLGVAASELRDVRVRLDQLWGERAARVLAERISCRDDDDGRAAELENAARQMAAGAWRLDVVASEVTDRLRTARTASARELARATHLSERQLHRRCTAAFGYGPEFLMRICRIQRFLQLAREEPGPPRLAGLAIDAGYADQPHLTREVRSIMGTTPAQLLRSSSECPTGSRRRSPPVPRWRNDVPRRSAASGW